MICKARGKGNHYDKNGKPQNCKFPFTYAGKRYNGCTTAGCTSGSWCATKVDSKGNYVKDNWARCNGYCKRDCGMSKVYITLVNYVLTNC